MRCPAKLNLGLEVLHRDASSGYHHIATVMQALSLCDRLELSVAEGDWDFPALEIGGPFAHEVPAENNSLLAAWGVLGGSVAFPALRIRLDKRIPAQSGLGGASSNAAGMLLAMRELARLLCFDCERGVPLPPANLESRLDETGRHAKLGQIAELDDHALTQLAAKTGMDSPFFLSGACQLATGFGELLTPIERRLHFHALVCVPQFGSATASAYAALARGTSPRQPICMALAQQALEQADWDLLAGTLVSDFAPVLLGSHPEYEKWFDLLANHAARAVLHSGSGSGFYGLFEQEADALAARGALLACAPMRLCEVASPLRY